MDAEPLVSVVRGTPTDQELAALAAIFAIRSTAMDATSRPAARSAWTMSARPSMGPLSWRHSALPR
ncbi:acyl-CoA carboxylase epsilon subunit [Paractinoplanes rhizophilus]|uniref:Acyl-CoA carboxylase epsilon subunit n=1 Tax=Paractinoplanes rhizophilus TaxID=1416877 RepID=A0ABW2HS73_9ACTN|nr:acyl-CoA carboxylase epsilon subunit [Actinoplanes sp.]